RTNLCPGSGDNQEYRNIKRPFPPAPVWHTSRSAKLTATSFRASSFQYLASSSCLSRSSCSSRSKHLERLERLEPINSSIVELLHISWRGKFPGRWEERELKVDMTRLHRILSTKN